MSESYTPKKLREIINSKNPNGPEYDPYGTRELTSLPELPAGLTELWCRGNQLTDAAQRKIEEQRRIIGSKFF